MKTGIRKSLFPIALLFACWPCLAFAQQSFSQSTQTATQVGIRQRMMNPIPIPPDAHPPARVLPGVSASIEALAFSPDGKWLAWGGDDTITIWNATTGAEERRLTLSRPQRTSFTALAFDPDGTRLSALADGKLRTWDLQTGKTSSVDFRARVFSFTYSPDGKFWAAPTFDPHKDSLGTIQVGDATTGKIVRSIPTKWWRVTSMTITRDGLLIASGATHEDEGEEEEPQGTIQIWELASGNLVKTSPEFPIIGEVSPDGLLMAAGASTEPGKPETVITNLSTGHVKWTFPQVGTTFFSPDSQELAIANDSDQGFTVWSVVTGAAIFSFRLERNPSEPGGPTIIAFNSDGKRLAATSSPVSAVKLWDVPTHQELLEFAGQYSFQALAMSPDGKWLASAAPGLTVQDPKTGNVIRTLSLDYADMLAFSPDGRWLAANPGAFGGPGRSLEVWDTKTWNLVANVTPPRDTRHNAPVMWFAFGNPSPQTTLGNAQSIQFTADGQTHTVWVSDAPMAASPDGKLLAEMGHPTYNFVDIWDTSSGQNVKTFLAHDAITINLAFSTDGRWLLTLGQDYRFPKEYLVYPRTGLYKVKLWDVATWKETTSLSFPAIRPFSALLSSDGHKLAIERSRQLVDVFNADNGNPLGSFAAPPAERDGGWSMGKPNLAFSPDGTLLLQGAKAGIRVWKLPQP